MDISVISTRTVPTVKVTLHNKPIILHSKYDPLNEAAAWCKTASKVIKDTENMLVIGLGAGYHIEQLAQTQPNKTIFAVEFNDEYFNWFMNSEFFERLSSIKNIVFYSFEKMSDDERRQLFSSFSSTNIAIHKSGTDLMPAEFEKVLKILNDLKYQQNSVSSQIDTLVDNFKKNTLLGDKSINSLQKVYRNKPMILVSAGPSLTKQLPLLKQAKEDGHVIIGAVGTAVKPLLNAGIVPDFFMMTDPSSATYSQLTDISLPYTSFLYLCTAYHDTVLLHTGPRYIVYQHGFDLAERRAGEKGEPCMQTGGSVATTLLDTMIQLGASSVALVGQDLAYTNNQSHAEGAHLQKEIRGESKLLQTENYHRDGYVYTAKNLTIYRQWFEAYAKKHPGIPLYNCTEGGAFIGNWEHVEFSDYLNRIDF